MRDFLKEKVRARARIHTCTCACTSPVDPRSRACVQITRTHACMPLRPPLRARALTQKGSVLVFTRRGGGVRRGPSLTGHWQGLQTQTQKGTTFDAPCTQVHVPLRALLECIRTCVCACTFDSCVECIRTCVCVCTFDSCVFTSLLLLHQLTRLIPCGPKPIHICKYLQMYDEGLFDSQLKGTSVDPER